MAIFQDNSDKSKLITRDMLEDNQYTLIFNRDQKFHAEGRVFIDDGTTISSLNNGDYLYYNFVHNDKSIIK